MSNSSIWLIDRILSGATSPGQSRPGSNGNEGILHIPQSFIIGAVPSDALISYPGHPFGVGSFPSAEIQSVYSTAPAEWANKFKDKGSYV